MRILSIVLMALVSVLFVLNRSQAEVSFPPDRTPVKVEANNNLLISRMPAAESKFGNHRQLSQEAQTFEEQMAEAGWDVSNPNNLLFYNVRQIIKRESLASLEDEINNKVFQARRGSKIVARSV